MACLPTMLVVHIVLSTVYLGMSRQQLANYMTFDLYFACQFFFTVSMSSSQVKDSQSSQSL